MCSVLCGWTSLGRMSIEWKDIYVEEYRMSEHVEMPYISLVGSPSQHRDCCSIGLTIPPLTEETLNHL